MVNAPTPPGYSGGTLSDEGWGPATSVRSPALPPEGQPLPVELDPRGPSPRSLRSRASLRRRAPDGGARPEASGTPGSSWIPQADRIPAADGPADSRLPHSRPVVQERGLPGWAALLVLLTIAGAGALIDTISGAAARGGFNIGIVVASVVAILVVRRSAMFPIVVAPPIVYSGASGAMLYLRSNGLNDRAVLLDAATNWLVYGFPAIAGATAAVLIIAGIRLIARR